MMGEVFAWNKTAGNADGKPFEPNWPRLRQAVAHVGEERMELVAAMAKLEKEWPLAETAQMKAALLVEVADAALDGIWVNMNALQMLGLPSQTAALLWCHAAQANWQKLPVCSNCHGEAVVGEFGAEICKTCKGTGFLPPIRSNVGKILKPVGWQSPTEHQVASILNAMAKEQSNDIG